jgi:hypothetical protein
MTDKLGLEEALRKLARSSRRAALKRDRAPSSVKSAHRANGNEEFHEQPSAGLVWCLVALIALALIDWFAAKWL